jgi:Kef-type K+ transport system membrane component KefB
MNPASLGSLLLVMIVAAAAPIVSRLLPGRPPQVLFLILGGVAIGPHVLGFANGADVQLLADLGLGFIFLLAGYELDPSVLRERAGRQAIVAWFLSAGLAVGVVGALAAVGFVHAFVPVAIGLTTTALGTLLPILREQKMLGGPFGRLILAAGVVGELLPILAISLFLGAEETWWEALVIASIAALALAIAWVVRIVSRTRIAHIIMEKRHDTSQATLRITVVLLVGLLLVTREFGIEAALGAFFAGMVLRRSATGDERHSFEEKLDAVGYGIFIPVFFISSGMGLDIGSIGADPLRLVVFLVLLLVVRGVPGFLVYRSSLVRHERYEAVLLTATALPLLVAIAEVGLDSGVMLPENAAALVGAGVLSVALFPLLAIRIRHRADAAAAADGASVPVHTD